MKIEIPKMLRTITLLLILLLVLSVWTAWPSRGAVPKLDTIRVGIFLEVPNKYKLNTTTATFSSPSAMQIGLRQPSAVLPMGQTKAGETIRFTLDDYKPIVAETVNFQAALSVVKRLKAIGGTGILSSVYRNSGLVYQVVEGSYATSAEARTAADRWGKDAVIAGAAGTAKLELMGPLHMEAGQFVSKEEAVKAAQAFGAVGINAFAAMKQTGEANPTYSTGRCFSRCRRPCKCEGTSW